MTQDSYSQYLPKLEGERSKLLREIEEHSGHPLMASDTRDDAAEVNEAEEFANQLGIAQAFKERLEEVENAINKIKEGKYGLCERCGKPIDQKILEQSPAMRYCHECNSR